MLEPIIERVVNGARIHPEEALELYEKADLLTLGALAEQVRRRLHPEGEVTYILDRNINYTNACNAFCSFCAFYRPPSHEEAYVLSYEAIAAKIRQLKGAGGIQILLQGGHNPDLKIDYYEELVRRLKSDFPDIWLHALSPPEITHIRKSSRLTLRQTIERLREAGLDSIPGGGAEILVDDVRLRLATNKCSAGEWLDVMEEAHRQEVRSTATMMFGHIETLSQRIEHLARLRELQDRTGGFTAFICWTYQPGNTDLGGRSASLSTRSPAEANLAAARRHWLARGFPAVSKVKHIPPGWEPGADLRR